MLRPLPPFRAKPARKTFVTKSPAGKDEAPAVSIKARRLSIKVTRGPAAPTLKVLGRSADKHA